jgi:hypothetical protein
LKGYEELISAKKSIGNLRCVAVVEEVSYVPSSLTELVVYFYV